MAHEFDTEKELKLILSEVNKFYLEARSKILGQSSCYWYIESVFDSLIKREAYLPVFTAMALLPVELNESGEVTKYHKDSHRDYAKLYLELCKKGSGDKKSHSNTLRSFVEENYFIDLLFLEQFSIYEKFLSNWQAQTQYSHWYLDFSERWSNHVQRCIDLIESQFPYLVSIERYFAFDVEGTQELKLSQFSANLWKFAYPKIAPSNKSEKEFLKSLLYEEPMIVRNLRQNFINRNSRRGS